MDAAVVVALTAVLEDHREDMAVLAVVMVALVVDLIAEAVVVSEVVSEEDPVAVFVVDQQIPLWSRFLSSLLSALPFPPRNPLPW